MNTKIKLGEQLKKYLEQIDNINLDDVHHDTSVLDEDKTKTKTIIDKFNKTKTKSTKQKVKTKETDTKETDTKEAKTEEEDDLVHNLKNEINVDEKTIELLTKDLHPGRFFSKRQTTKYSDLTVVAMLIKYQFIKKYKCCKCKITDKHNRKPITLLINHINGHKDDYSVKNLELICPNCYFQTYGINLLEKKIEKEIYTCKYCNYPLNSTQRMNRNLLRDKDKCVCFVCSRKINENNTNTTLDDYEEEFKKLKKNSYKNAEEINKLINTFRVDDYNGEFDSDHEDIEVKFDNDITRNIKLEDTDLNINLKLDKLMGIDDIEITDDSDSNSD